MAQNVTYIILVILLINLTAIYGAGEVRYSGPKCKTPNGDTYTFGDILLRGCTKYMCNGLKWAVKSTNMCCSYQQKKFKIRSVISSVVSEDGCTTASLKCIPVGDRAKIDMRIQNECPKPASEDTLKMYMDELKDLLEQHVNESEIPAVTTAAPATTTAAPICDSGWDYVQGSCYRVLTLNETWEAARNSCIDLGGDLATVSSVAVQAKLFDLQNEVDVWIGGNDLTTDTAFTWTNGDAWTYDNWNTNQPNNLSGQDCVKMKKNTGRWDDVSCGGQFMFACQKLYTGTFSFSNPGGNQQSMQSILFD